MGIGQSTVHASAAAHRQGATSLAHASARTGAAELMLLLLPLAEIGLRAVGIARRRDVGRRLDLPAAGGPEKLLRRIAEIATVEPVRVELGGSGAGEGAQLVRRHPALVGPVVPGRRVDGSRVCANTAAGANLVDREAVALAELVGLTLRLRQAGLASVGAGGGHIGILGPVSDPALHRALLDGSAQFHLGRQNQRRPLAV